MIMNYSTTIPMRSLVTAFTVSTVNLLSGHHHDAYHVNIIGFDMSHSIVDELSHLPPRYLMMSFTMFMAVMGIPPFELSLKVTKGQM